MLSSAHIHLYGLRRRIAADLLRVGDVHGWLQRTPLPLHQSCARWVATTAQQPSHIRNATPLTAAELKAELMRFARQHSGSERLTKRALSAVEFPSDLSPDADAVVLGEKTLLADEDALEFACTGCGGCCRGFSDTVLIDPADLFAMATATHNNNTRALPHQRPDAFRLQTGFFHINALPRGFQSVQLTHENGGAALGFVPSDALLSEAGQRALHVGLERFEYGPGAAARMFSADAFPASQSASVEHRNDDDGEEDDDEDDGFGKRRLGPSSAEEPLLQGGFVPILYLQSRPVASPAGSSGAAGSGSGATSEADRSRRPRHRQRNSSNSGAGGRAVSMTSDPTIVVLANDGDRICSFAVPGKRTPKADVSMGTSTSTTGLSCSLGPLGMPYTCALYPLGDFWSRAVQVPTQQHAQQQHFYALDHVRCEGVVASSPSSPPSSSLNNVAGYRRAPHRRLDERKHRSEWFRRLCTTVAALQLDQRLGAAFETASARWMELQAARRAATQAANAGEGKDVHDHNAFSAEGVSMMPLATQAQVMAPLLEPLLHRAIARAAGSGSAPSISITSADDCAAFVYSLLAEAWYYHPYSLDATSSTTATTTTTTGKEAVSSWEAWQRGVEERTRAVAAYLDAAVARLHAMGEAWEGERTRLAVSSLPPPATRDPATGSTQAEAEAKGNTEAEPLSGFSGTVSSPSSRSSGRRRRRDSSSQQQQPKAPASTPKRPSLGFPVFADAVRASFDNEKDAERLFVESAEVELANAVAQALAFPQLTPAP